MQNSPWTITKSAKNHCHPLAPRCFKVPGDLATDLPMTDCVSTSRETNEIPNGLETRPRCISKFQNRSLPDPSPLALDPLPLPLLRRGEKGRERSTGWRSIVFNQSWWEGTAGNSHRESYAAGSPCRRWFGGARVLVEYSNEYKREGPFRSHGMSAAGVRNRILRFTHTDTRTCACVRASLINH